MRSANCWGEWRLRVMHPRLDVKAGGSHLTISLTQNLSQSREINVFENLERSSARQGMLSPERNGFRSLESVVLCPDARNPAIVVQHRGFRCQQSVHAVVQDGHGVDAG